jgi:hypothetical protein
MILGIDVSTSCTGFAVLDDDKNIIYTSNVKVKDPSKKHINEVVDCFLGELEKINTDYEITSICIEKPLFRFTRGKSTANTIARLLQINCLVAYVCEKEFGFTPDHISSSTARDVIGVKFPEIWKKKGFKKKSNDVKQHVLKYVLEIYPDFVYARTRNDTPAAGVFDIVDAIVVARAYIEQGNNT